MSEENMSLTSEQTPAAASVEEIVKSEARILWVGLPWTHEQLRNTETAVRRAITRALATASSPSEDTKRLDWLDVNAKRVFFQPHAQDCVIIDIKEGNKPSPWGKTLRAAIDAAMSASSVTPK